MSFIALSKSLHGFPIGAGDEMGRCSGGEFVIAPCFNQWRVFIFCAGRIVNTSRIPHLNAARSYALTYLEDDHASL